MFVLYALIRRMENNEFVSDVLPSNGPCPNINRKLLYYWKGFNNNERRFAAPGPGYNVTTH